MAARCKELGDIGPSAPSKWEDGLGRGEAHVLVTLYGAEKGVRDQRLRECETRVRADRGLRIVGNPHRADILPRAREHFGFADGFSQPAVVGSGRPPHSGRRPAALSPLAAPATRRVRPGPSRRGRRRARPRRGAAAQRHVHGVAKLAQDVPLFRRWMTELAGDDPDEFERVAAKVVGRWRRARRSSARPIPRRRPGAARGSKQYATGNQ